MKLSLFIFFIFTAACSAQEIKQIRLISGERSANIPAFVREGIIYFDVKEFARIETGSYYYNEETEKIELKFSDYNLKITAKNPFLIATSRKSKQSEVYQLPTSTYLIDNKIFIPLVYSLGIIRKVSGIDLKFETGRLIVKEDIKSPGTKSRFDITGITLDEKANGTLVRIRSAKRIATYNSSFKDGVLKVIFRNVNADADRLSFSGGRGLVKEIEARNTEKDTEILFTLGKEYTTNEVLNADGSNDILISIHNKIFARDEDREKNRTKWDFDVIVIDPGHGGKDVGAIGVNKAREKDITLGIALKLGRMIESKMKDVKVVYTRKEDAFVELYKRGKIANDEGGKLFISLHCNSAPKKARGANGFEIYLLRPGRTAEAIEIAELENSVIRYEDNPERYQKLTDENFILVTMAHSAYMKYSEKFSDLLHRQFSNDLSLQSRGIKQAGFYVLVGASMPGVLVEAGFLSNKKEADYLKSSRGQSEIAESVFKAVESYRDYYKKVIDAEL